MLSHIFHDLIRRNVIRVAAIYIIVGWLLRRFTDFMVPFLGLPAFFDSFVLILIFLGLPICLALSWLYDYTPEGIKLTPPMSADELHATYKLGRTDYILTGIVGFILVIVGIDTFMPGNSASRPAQGTVTEISRNIDTVAGNQTAAPQAAELPAAPSIAVLPFSDESEEGDQEYFSDGVAEEILNSLVKVRGVRVPGRTSSFAFKNSELPISEIASQLNVANILEGGVRKQQDQLRISVRMINVADGTVRWSETYTGSLQEIFDLQERIARGVAQELEVVLTGVETERLSRRQTQNVEAHTSYLLGRKFLGARVGDNLPKAVQAFEEAIAIDPGYAPAWAGLASAHALTPQYRVVDFFDAYTQAELNARRAIQIDSDMSEPYAVLGWIHLQRREYSQMRAEFEKALAINPADVTANLWYGIGNVAVGKTAEADRRFSFVVERDPVALVGVHMQSLVGWMLGRSEEAERRASRVYRMGYPPSGLQLGEISGEQGDLQASAEYISMGMRGMATTFSEENRLIMGLGLYGDSAARQKALDVVDAYIATDEPKQEIFIPYFLIRVAEVEKAFAMYEANRAAFDPLIYYAIWGPYGEQARQHPEFPAFAERLGLIDYWQTYGWPDVCETPEMTSLPCA